MNVRNDNDRKPFYLWRSKIKQSTQRIVFRRYTIIIFFVFKQRRTVVCQIKKIIMLRKNFCKRKFT